jgi:asparagine synthase (glutamine-hydrolysing)
MRLDWRAAYALRFSGFTPGERAFLTPDHVGSAHYWRLPRENGRSDLATLLEIDRLNYLPDYILRKADLCTMAHGLEMRAPFLDHRFYATLLALPERERFTTPAKKLLAPLLAPIEDRQPFERKKRGFNPPLEGWLDGDLAPRQEGLGARLAATSSGQLDAARVDTLVASWRGGDKRLGEQLLQLMLLDESLAQLRALAANPVER